MIETMSDAWDLLVDGATLVDARGRRLTSTPDGTRIDGEPCCLDFEEFCECTVFEHPLSLAEGRKDDAGKPRWSLVPVGVVQEVEAAWRDEVAAPAAEARAFAWEVIYECGNRGEGVVNAIAGLVELLGPNARYAAWAQVTRVFEHGAGKYGDENYLGVEPDRYIDAAFRHLFLASGPDEESGIDHVAHAIASLVIYRALTKAKS